jgi:hypothetical protein
LIGNDPGFFYETCLVGWGAAKIADFDREMIGAYRAAGDMIAFFVRRHTEREGVQSGARRRGDQAGLGPKTPLH